MARSPKALAAGQSLQGLMDHLGYTAQRGQPLVDAFMDIVEQGERIENNVYQTGVASLAQNLEVTPE